jgi:hypothetical protein
LEFQPSEQDNPSSINISRQNRGIKEYLTAIVKSSPIMFEILLKNKEV